MDFNVNDSDVKVYLNEIKALSFKLGTSSIPATENLAVILDLIKSNVHEMQCQTQEQHDFLLVRATQLSSLLEAHESKTKKTNNIDLRYGFHKSIQPSIKTVSKFMYMVNNHIDIDISENSSQIAEYKREVANITQTLSELRDLIDYFNIVYAQLPILIDLCKNT